MGKILWIVYVSLSLTGAWAQVNRPTLNDLSQKMNKELPEVWDHVTKLMSTTVENNNFYYHFKLNATQAEYDKFMPKVKAQVLSSVCSKAREKVLLRDYRANLIYRYESVKGISLGEFMIKAEHCL